MIDLEKILKKALEPTLDAILRMEAGVTCSVRSALRVLRANLVESGYTVADLLRQLGARGNNWIASQFKAATGLTIWHFIQEMRLELSARLLRDTLVLVGDIVMLVGYEDLSSFSRLFQQWCGMTPSEFRERIRETRRRAGPIPPGIFSWFYWRRCWRGELTVDEVRELIAYLERVYGPPAVP